MTGIRIITNQTRTLILLTLLAALMFAFSSPPLSALYFVALGLILFPLAGLMLSAVGGWLPLLSGCALIAWGATRLFGQPGLLALVYVMPAGTALMVCLERRLPFFKTVLAVLGAYILGVLAFYLLLQHATGGIIPYATKAAVSGLEQLPQRDAFLYSLWKSGFLSHGQPSGTQVFIEQGRGWTFTPDVLQEFFKQIAFRVEGFLQSVFQGLITSYGIYLAALGSYLAIRLGKSARPHSCPDLEMPPFSLWYIPRAIGKKLWVLAAGYLLMLLGTDPVLQLAGGLMFNVFYALYVLQGLALLDHRLSRGRLGPWLKLLALGLLFVLLQPVLVFMGIIDQSRDTRELRGENRETGEE